MAFATVEDVTKRLEEEPTERMLVMIEEYLEEASDVARYYGREWSDLDVPNAVRRIVASAVARFMRNPDGYQTSRAGDETVAWFDRGSEIDWFTEQEIERIGRQATSKRLRAFGTMQMLAGVNGHRPTGTAVCVPSTGGGSRAPFLDADDPLTGRYA